MLSTQRFVGRMDNKGEELDKHLYNMLERKTIVGVYDFSKSGGAQNAVINIKYYNDPSKDIVFPAGTIISNALIYTEAAITPAATTTVAIGTGAAADDIRTAAAVGSTLLGGTGALVSTKLGLLGTGNTAEVAIVKVVTSAAVTPTLTIAAGAVTAGKIRIIFEVYMPK